MHVARVSPVWRLGSEQEHPNQDYSKRTGQKPWDLFRPDLRSHTALRLLRSGSYERTMGSPVSRAWKKETVLLDGGMTRSHCTRA